jgi:pullulanase/glycogen debranching enzyme
MRRESTLCWRGLDNRTSDVLGGHDLARSRDFTSCGHALALHRTLPQVTKLVLDSLRHWVTEFHVDGFRFDLATTLARGPAGEFEFDAALFTAIFQDPALSRVKLIAEPWDVGPRGCRLGSFLPPSHSGRTATGRPCGASGETRVACRGMWSSASLAPRTSSGCPGGAQRRRPTASPVTTASP